jgi:uncharacterized membrane protein YkoI
MEKVRIRRYATVVILIGLLLGAVLAGAIAFRGIPVLAQSGVNEDDEAEDGDLDDAAEGADAPITDPALERAETTALEYTGGGRVTATEVSDEEGYYEVEVTLPNGRQVDVHLDASFNILSAENE